MGLSEPRDQIGLSESKEKTQKTCLTGLDNNVLTAQQEFYKKTPNMDVDRGSDLIQPLKGEIRILEKEESFENSPDSMDSESTDFPEFVPSVVPSPLLGNESVILSSRNEFQFSETSEENFDEACEVYV